MHSQSDPRVGLRSREWTAVGATEAEVVVEMARCLREIGGRGAGIVVDLSLIHI